MTYAEMTDTQHIGQARTKTLPANNDRQTEHHSYTGRAEYIAELCEAWRAANPGKGVADYKKPGFAFLLKADWQSMVSAVKARYPWHASQAHVVAAIKAYFVRVARQAAKASEAKSVTVASPGKAKAVKPTAKAKAQAKKRATAKSARKQATPKEQATA